MNNRTGMLLFLAAMIAAPANAMAQSCTAHLANRGLNANAVQLVTLNRKGVSSSSTFGVTYRPPIRMPQGPVLQANWTSEGQTGAKQLFSDRGRPLGGHVYQPYDIQRPDLITVKITAEASPQVTITLRSWGNVKSTFRATCAGNGVMHGSTDDVDYLLFLTQSALL